MRPSSIQKRSTVRRTLRRFHAESLETRDMLTALDCMPCDSPVRGDEIVLSSASVDHIPEVANRATQDVQTASVSTRNVSEFESLYGVPQNVGPIQGTQVVQGPIDQRVISVYRLSPKTETDVTISLADNTSVQLLLVSADQPLNFEDAIHSANGMLSTTLSAQDYVLYAFDFSRVDQFELTITANNSLPPFEEFAELPYIGRSFDWNLNAVNAPEVWARGFTGDGALVAVVDTGVDYLHPDLNDNIWTNPGEIAGDGIDNDRNGFVDDIHGWDFAFRDNDPRDRHGHGTHVAGTIAAARDGQGTTGVAYDATILPVKVLGDNGSGSPNAIAAGIRYAVDVGADVINLSLGGGVTRTLQAALQYAANNDVFVVAASGNDNATRPGAPAVYSSVLSNMISVGAHDQAGIRSGFSNRVGNSNAVQIDAPGSGVASTFLNNGYRSLNGTSMAAPHVAGVAALALSANPELTAAELRELITLGASQFVVSSDSIGGVDAARTVARAFQYDAFSMNRSGLAVSTILATANVPISVASVDPITSFPRKSAGKLTMIAAAVENTEAAKTLPIRRTTDPLEVRTVDTDSNTGRASTLDVASVDLIFDSSSDEVLDPTTSHPSVEMA